MPVNQADAFLDGAARLTGAAMRRGRCRQSAIIAA
jgi:hypothetical protein